MKWTGHRSLSWLRRGKSKRPARQLLFCIIFAWIDMFLPGVAIAGGMRDCEQFHGQGVGSKTDFPPYQVVLKFFDCAGIRRNVAELDALDHDMLVWRARIMSLEELSTQETKTKPPLRYSKLIRSSGLRKFKQLVDAYYTNGVFS